MLLPLSRAGVLNCCILQPRALKGVSYVAKQRDGGSVSSADEHDEDSDGAKVDEDGENRPHSTAALKPAASTIKKKQDTVSLVHSHIDIRRL